MYFFKNKYPYSIKDVSIGDIVKLIVSNELVPLNFTTVNDFLILNILNSNIIVNIDDIINSAAFLECDLQHVEMFGDYFSASTDGLIGIPVEYIWKLNKA